eukprot:2577578-Pyramimonas_sp.AAC.1
MSLQSRSLESRNGAVTDRAVTSQSPKTSPHGPSTHGSGTSGAPVARDVFGERPESQNRAVTRTPTDSPHGVVTTP